MEGYGTMPAASMVCMALSLALSAGLPLALLVWLRRRGGCIRSFLLGAAVFYGFAMVLEQGAHGLILGGAAGPAITGNLGLYALYGGLMAGLFEETGRLAAFFLLRRSPDRDRPVQSLMYGAGHGGMEAVLLVALTNLSNLILSVWINTGTLEQNLGPLDQATAQAVAQAVAAPPASWLWGGLERVVAIAIHLSLSVLVYAAVRERRWGKFALAVLLHTGVDACTILVSAFLPLAAVELAALVWAVGLALVARRTYRALARPERKLEQSL